MIYKCYLKKDTVFVPTVVRLQSPVYMDVDPVAVISVTDSLGLRKAFLDTIARKNNSVSPSSEEIRGRPVILKYSRDRNWSAFQRGASIWHIKENDGNYQIIPYSTQQKGYWAPDLDHAIEFHPGTMVTDVIDRMIAILQNAARK